MLESLIFLLMALALMLWWNKGLFARLGAGGTLRLLLIWGCIFVAGVLLVQLIGVPERWQQPGDRAPQSARLSP
ncbi:hypothetical protein [Sandaracinobacteroides saxicola]|uniref:Uncharacterized protein n=1 Tax=Sandaracinobacteroides saxicola TaxID=2759707 RepID=A0A7G5ILQ4_9SPHN|nr:hypothetical protein [Sandaracinobacteroides saxicola]QMW24296.1 hypothetical protein H3309_07545 [Sandaracinobacteroides saxicola]